MNKNFSTRTWTDDELLGIIRGGIITPYDELLKELYNTDELTNVELNNEIKIELLYHRDSFDSSMACVPNYYYFACTNSQGDEGIIATEIYPEHILGCNNAKVILPFSKVKIRKGINEIIIIRNLISNKERLFCMARKQFLQKESYDLIEKIQGCLDINVNDKTDGLGFVLHNNSKVGFTDYLALLHNGITQTGIPVRYYRNKNIPIKFDEIKLTESNDLIQVVNKDLVGAYFFFNSYHEIRTKDGWEKLRYLAKKYIPAVFEKIEIFYLDPYKKQFIFEVYLGGKVGLLNQYTNHIIAPIVFDSIISYDGKYTRGIIDDTECIYDGNKFEKCISFTPNYPKEYNKLLTRKRTKKEYHNDIQLR